MSPLVGRLGLTPKSFVIVGMGGKVNTYRETGCLRQARPPQNRHRRNSLEEGSFEQEDSKKAASGPSLDEYCLVEGSLEEGRL